MEKAKEVEIESFILVCLSNLDLIVENNSDTTFFSRLLLSL